MERIGIYGGTFDPIHIGHLVVAVEVRASLRLDRVLMMVAGDPWQKRGMVVAPAADRLAMVEAAVAGLDGIEGSAVEVDRAGPSYTIDTLEALHAPDRELWLIVGADVVSSLETWHEWERVAAMCTLAVVDRPGAGTTAGSASSPVPAAPWRWERVAVPQIDVSSRDIRARAAGGRPIEALVPAPALRLLRARGLYTARQ